jgi:DNA-binding transcriptional LysR family regulator
LELLMKDELVAVTSPKNCLAKNTSVSLHELKHLPWALREKGSGTRNVAEQGLKSIGLPVQSICNVTSLESTEAIKSFLEVGDGVSILSRKSIKNELALGLLQILPVNGLNLERPFNFIYPHGPRPNGVVGEFIRFGMKFNR